MLVKPADIKDILYLTGERRPFHPNKEKFGLPKKQLEFIVLEKKMNNS
jgi:hypothetical protein